MAAVATPDRLSLAFPQPWEPFHRPLCADVEIFHLRWVAAILDVAGWSIHDLINRAEARWAVREAWKAWKALERDLAGRTEKEWREYVSWLRRIGLPVSA